MEKERHPNDTIKVLLADDHTMFRQGIAGVLDDYASMEVVGQTTNDGGPWSWPAGPSPTSF
jgi:DNA-binding NarL/FixJ family response regulator